MYQKLNKPGEKTCLHDILAMCLTFRNTKKPSGSINSGVNLPLRFSSWRCMEESSTLVAPWLSSTTEGRNCQNIIFFGQRKKLHLDFSIEHQSTEKHNVSNVSANCTFLLGECMTGAGGDGGPRGIFLLILKHNYTHEISSVFSSGWEGG